jgi:shikimate kinase
MTLRGRPRLIVLTGPVCAGKTTLAALLAEALDGQTLAARAVIERASGADTRAALQSSGAELERESDGQWLAAAAVSYGQRPLIVDAAKTEAQLKGLIELQEATQTIYLDASEKICRERYSQRNDPVDQGQGFDELMQGELAEQPGLKRLADVVIDTGGRSPEEVGEAALAVLLP